MIFEDKDLTTVIDTLISAGYEAYLVGGCVRDTLLGKTPHDYDIATNAMPEETAKCFSAYDVIPTGMKHGTVTVVINHRPFEITTYRVDGDYEDHRHPTRVAFSKNLRDDLSRRDFTVNAIAASVDGEVYDPFSGQDDLKSQIIRCVGDPDMRFNEDALRILRAVRFSAVLGFDIEKNTKRAIFDNRELLKYISVERIFAELTKTLAAAHPDKITEFCDVVRVFAPEFTQDTFKQGVYTLCKLDINRSLCLSLAAFLCFAVDEQGVHNVLNRLKSDKKTLSAVSQLIKYKNIEIPEKPLKLVSVIGFDRMRDLIMLQSAMGMIDKTDADGMLETIFKLEKFHPCVEIKDLKIDGKDLIDEGYEGPVLGEILSFLLDSVLEEKVPNDKEALMLLANDQYKKYRSQ